MSDQTTRFERATFERLSATNNGDHWLVVNDAGTSTYTVDLNAGECSCRDNTHRGTTHTCKHQQYVQMVVGIKAVDVDQTGDDTPVIGLGEADALRVSL